MKPYTPKGSRYLVRQRRAPSIIRPTKLAAGMAYTASRSGHWKSVTRDVPDGLTLSVRGTLARGGTLVFWIERKPCPTCRSKLSGKLVLNDKGRLRLAALRKAQEARSSMSKAKEG